MVKTAWIVGCGPSLLEGDFPCSGLVIACNRAIEAVPAKIWIWVDRMHHDRSAWHPNAQRARRYGPDEYASAYRPETRTYRLTRRLPAEEGELYLKGGTLVPAAHLAIRLGTEDLVFVACDGWAPNRQRLYGWDARALQPDERKGHERHLAETAAGIGDLASAYPDVRFSDATTGMRHLELRDWEGKRDAQGKTVAPVAR